MLSRRRCLAVAAACAANVNGFAQPSTSLRFLEAAPQDLFGHYVTSLLVTAVERSKLPLRIESVPSSSVIQGRLELELIRPASHLNLMWPQPDAQKGCAPAWWGAPFSGMVDCLTS